ncbi:Cardiolipin synthase A [Ureibacillus acetophenoni]
MELFRNNLEQEIFKSMQMCAEKIVIISPFISLNIAEKLVQIVKEKNIDCIIITRFERKSFIEKASSIEALRVLVESGISVFALKDLHTKLYLIDDKSCYVGSANFTNKGLNINHELLLYFDEETEVEKLNSYANKLIKQLDDWSITIERIQREQAIIEGYNETQKEKISNSWGADLKTEELVDEKAYVLSVPAGDTIHLIEKYYVHAHPISSGYNYSTTKYITFRKPNGGVMDKIYRINKTFPIEMKEWESEIEKLDIPDTIKDSVANYIVDRYKDFEFDKAPKYKFYLLKLLCDLPNEPHPPTNNAGGWLYTIKDLKESTGQVFTIKQMAKKQKEVIDYVGR